MSFSEYRGSEEFQIDQAEIAATPALAGNVVAGNGTEYGLYTTSNGIGTELRTEQGDPALTRSEYGMWQVQPGYQDVIKDEDIDLAETKYQEIIKDNPNFSNGNTDEEPTFTPGFISVGGEDQEASLTNDDDGGGDNVDKLRENYKTGKVDHIIQKLSLRNLVYPMDADFGNTQDYIQINQFTYKPVNQNIFFADSNKEKRDDGSGFFGLLKNGVKNGSPKEKHLGLVKLPMPNQLQDSNNVAWGQDQLNAITAAVSSEVFGTTGGAINLIQEILKGNKTFGDIVQSAKKGAEDLIGNLAQASTDAKGVLTSTDAGLLGRSVIGSALLNIAQFGVTPETALARGAGVVPNSNMQLLFNAPTLREFTFNWRLTPRSREEAIRIKNIIRFFKQGMAVKKGNKTKSGTSTSFFLGTPNIFDITFRTAKESNELLDRNDSVLRIKTCALTGVAVNYTPDGMWNAYEKGMPTSVLLSLRFGELEPIFDTDYEEDPFEYDSSRPDIRPVPIDAIGY
jgi:hypothetical protein